MTGRAPPPLNALRTFEVFARHASMTRAAAELCVTHGAVSRQIAALQAALGVRLVSGPRHALVLTEAGRRLAEALTPAFGAITEAVAEARGETVREIEISCLGTFALKWLIPRLPSFLEAHPEVRVRLSESYLPVDFRRDRFDGAIRIVEPDQRHVRTESTRFLSQHQGPVGAPGLMAKMPTLQAVGAAPRLRSATFRQAWTVWADLAGVTLKGDAPEREFAHNHSLVEAAAGRRTTTRVPQSRTARPRRGRLPRLAGAGRRTQSAAAYSFDRSCLLNQATAAAKGTTIHRARPSTPFNSA